MAGPELDLPRGRCQTLPLPLASICRNRPQEPPQGQPRHRHGQPSNPSRLSSYPMPSGQTVHAARLAFSDAFHAGETIIDDIAASLGLDRETLRLASWGSSGLGLADGWLCYAYPQGLKWRNPDPAGKRRFPVDRRKGARPLAHGMGETRHPHRLSDGRGKRLPGLDCCRTRSRWHRRLRRITGHLVSARLGNAFRGKRVVLCFDTDPPGRAATATVAAILKGHASEILTWKGTASHV